MTNYIQILDNKINKGGTVKKIFDRFKKFKGLSKKEKIRLIIATIAFVIAIVAIIIGAAMISAIGETIDNSVTVGYVAGGKTEYAQSNTVSTDISSPVISNDAPTISSAEAIVTETTIASRGKGKTRTAYEVLFIVNWSDPGDLTKLHICKSSIILGQTCSTGSWCDSEQFSSASPTTCQTTLNQPRNESQNNFYAFVCDDDNLCSQTEIGSFILPGRTGGGGKPPKKK